jgi:thiol-disulfide isomerase/thioredoxin
MPSFVIKPERLAAVFVAAFLAVAVAGAADVTGQPLPRLTELKLDGTVPDLSGKVVLLDFWASWCAPCKASFPAMADLQKRFADRGLVILAVSVDDDARAYSRFVERQKPPFTTVRDSGHKLVASLSAPAMPTSFLVDRRGIVRFRHEGFHGESTIQSYTQQIEQLLAETAP